MDTAQRDRVRSGQGFFAALDQSGGSTPKALQGYGISPESYDGEQAMFDLVHAMRVRVMTSPAFDGDRILGAILFLQTLQREVDGVPSARYLWERKSVVPFLKVDLGLAPARDDVQLMKPIDTLEAQLETATRHGVFGTKMRSVIADANRAGIEAVVDQQFAYAARIRDAGLVPILEPEVSIESPRKAEAEALLADRLAERLDDLTPDAPVMFKLTLPTEPGLYSRFAGDPRVLRLLALSGGYDREQACALLAQDHSMIASFSRALLEGLSAQQSDEEFDATLDRAVHAIAAASRA